MNTLEIKIGNKAETILYPSCWNELTCQQLIDISDLFLQKKNEIQFRAESVLRIIGMQSLLRKRWTYLKFMIAAHKKDKDKTRLEKLIDEQDGLNISIYKISETLDFLFKNNTLTKNLIPGFRNMFGPSDLFGNVSLIEFSKADIRCKSYENTSDEKYLNELIAVLYRPSKHFWTILKHFTNDDDPRQPYGDKYIKNASFIAKWPLDVRNAIYLWYKGCMGGLMERYPHVFAESDNNGEVNGFGMAGLFTALAGEKFGNPDKTAETMLHHILIYLEQEAVIAEKRKSKTEKE